MKLLNEKGFSLVSVMVAAGMLGVLSLGVMQLTKTSSNTQTFFQSSMDSLDLSREVTLILSSPNDCAASFAGTTFRGSQIQTTSEDIQLWSSDQDGNRSRLRFSSDSADKQSKLGKVVINSINFSMPDYTGGDFPEGVNQSFKGVLRILAKKKITIKKTQNIKPILKTVKISFDTDGLGESTITGCGFVTDLAAALEELTCETTTGSVDVTLNGVTVSKDINLNRAFEGASYVGSKVFEYRLNCDNSNNGRHCRCWLDGVPVFNTGGVSTRSGRNRNRFSSYTLPACASKCGFSGRPYSCSDDGRNTTFQKTVSKTFNCINKVWTAE